LVDQAVVEHGVFTVYCEGYVKTTTRTIAKAETTPTAGEIETTASPKA
jgi:hypothetical protein